ncbi:MAG TPA: cytochrome c oxidase assembly protein [Chloroflexota bacterium]|nr:cytochrome c oxidase assembly protein [Chloroflexota bacterium]
MTSWPGVLLNWTFEPSVVAGALILAVLYWRGRQPLTVVRAGRASPITGWNAAAFYAGLAVVVVALESPIDSLSASLFSFHMVQHLLLIMVAAPLLLLGDPGVTLLRGTPLAARRAVLGFAARRIPLHGLGRAFSWLRRPETVFIVFLADLYLWHWSWLFNLTLQNASVHLLEHLCFLVTALLFWSQVIDQRVLHPRLPYIMRAVYVLITAFASNVLAMYLVFTPKPLYPVYAHLASRPYGMTALGDQQIAGAIMWVPVLFLFGGAFAILLYKALSQDERQTRTLSVGETPYSMPF